MTEVVAPASPASAFAAGTLARKLLLRVVALVAVAAVLLSLLTTLATRQLLVGQLDRQLESAMGRQLDYRGRYGGPDGSDPPPGRGLGVRGQQIGTLAAEFSPGSRPKIDLLQATQDDITLPKDEYAALVAQLQSVPVDGRPVSMSLAGDIGRVPADGRDAGRREGGGRAAAA